MSCPPVLLVEDDQSVALIIETILSAGGHRVRRAGNGQEALALTEQEAPGLLIADLNLPGALAGNALGRQLRAEWPDLPVILMSGDFEDTAAREDLLDRAAILPKPFRRAALMDAIEQARQTAG